MRDKSKD